MSDTLSKLERVIDRKCAEYINGVVPKYHPHLPQMRQLSLMCIQFLSTDTELFDVVSDVLPEKANAAAKLRSLLDVTARDIEEKGNISFYHYLGVMTSLSFHYGKMVDEGTYKDLKLEQESQWDNLTWEACVWSIFYVAGTIFEKPIKAHKAIFDSESTKIDDIIRYIKKQIKKQ